MSTNIEVTNPSLNLSVTRQTKNLTISSDVVYVGSETFTFNQGVPASTWTIVHNLGRHPAVSVVDTAGTVVFGEVIYDSANQVTVKFSSGFAGKAYLN